MQAENVLASLRICTSAWVPSLLDNATSIKSHMLGHHCPFFCFIQISLLCAPVCVEKYDEWFSTACSYMDFISVCKNVHSGLQTIRKRAKIRNQYN